MSIVVDPALPKDAATVELELVDGRRLTRSVRHNKGTPARPMSDGEIEAKFTDLAVPLIGAERSRRLVDLCWHLEDCGNVAELARLAGGGNAG